MNKLNCKFSLARALKTGDIIEIEKNINKYKFGKIVNPFKLMENLKK